MKSIKKYYNIEEFKKLNEAEKTLVQLIYRTPEKINQLIDTDILVIDQIVWDSDYNDFIKALKHFDINKVIFACNWSSSLGLLMTLLENDFIIDNTIIYYKEKTFSGRIETKKGIKLIRK